MPVLIVTSVHRIWMQPCNWYSFLITAATSCLSAAIPISPSPTPRACCRLPLSHTDFACYCYPTEVCFTKRVEADKSTGLAQALWLPLRPPASLLPPPTTSLLSPLTAGWQWFLSFSHRLCCSNPCVEGNNSPDRRSIPLGENLPSLTVFRCLRCQRCSSFRRFSPSPFGFSFIKTTTLPKRYRTVYKAFSFFILEVLKGKKNQSSETLNISNFMKNISDFGAVTVITF